MGLIFARTNFRELENFAFRESAMLRIFVNTNFHESVILRYFASTYICESIVFSFSRIGLTQTFREDLISRI